MLETLLSKLRGKKTAADYDAAIDEINGRLDELRGHLAVSATALTAAVFEKTPAEVAEVQAHRRNTEDEIALLQAALEGAQTRLEAARISERDDVVAQLVKQGTEARAAMRKAAIEFDAAIDSLVRAGKQIRQHYVVVEQINAKITAAGVPDQRLRVPGFGYFEDLHPAPVSMLQEMSPTKSFQALEGRGLA